MRAIWITHKPTFLSTRQRTHACVQDWAGAHVFARLLTGLTKGAIPLGERRIKSQIYDNLIVHPIAQLKKRLSTPVYDVMSLDTHKQLLANQKNAPTRHDKNAVAETVSDVTASRDTAAATAATADTHCDATSTAGVVVNTDTDHALRTMTITVDATHEGDSIKSDSQSHEAGAVAAACNGAPSRDAQQRSTTNTLNDTSQTGSSSDVIHATTTNGVAVSSQLVSESADGSADDVSRRQLPSRDKLQQSHMSASLDEVEEWAQVS